MLTAKPIRQSPVPISSSDEVNIDQDMGNTCLADVNSKQRPGTRARKAGVKIRLTVRAITSISGVSRSRFAAIALMERDRRMHLG